ncbi:MAG: hypothetical protein IH946_12850 [Bacteroidetes bacterium]|nr:hypothetical protein [Bacteroidota bacterium]
MTNIIFRDPAAARAGGYVLTITGILVAIGLFFHPMPTGGFKEEPSILENTPWWGLIHWIIAYGFVACVLGGLLVLIGGGVASRHWTNSLFWGCLTVGMIYFTGVSMMNGWVMHALAPHENEVPILYAAMNNMLIGFGWLGNPLFLIGGTGIAIIEVIKKDLGMKRWIAWFGAIVFILSWGRGIGSATGLYFLEPLIMANIPAFLWLSYYGWLLAKEAKAQETQA